VTGSSRGIGKAIARRLASEGAAVVVNSPVMGEEKGQAGTLESAVEDIQAMGAQAAPIACDLSDPEARADLIQRASEFFGPIDILVNNAAVGIMKLGSESTGDDLRFMFEVNVIAPVELAQQCLPHMKAHGAGWILNIGSGSHVQSELPYELQEHGIFVNCMRPTAIVLTEGADFVRDIARANPNMLEPVEMMAEGALELCTGRHVGRVIASREIVHYAARKVHSLDGKTVLGDAFLLGDPDATAAD
jgi:NAD(P)-dependent dehydrogenase (short-subunit alcohol dehydrogenase family)